MIERNVVVKIENKYVISTEHKVNFSSRLSYIRKILRQSKDTTSKELDKIEDDYLEEGNIDYTALNDEEYQYHVSEIANLKLEASTFPQILLKSLIVSAFSTLETNLSEIRIDTERKIKKQIKFKHLKSVGSEISNTINFLSLVHNIDFNQIESSLKTFNSYATIRNNIVHKNGNLTEENQQQKANIKKFIDTNEFISINENQELIFEKKFVDEFIKFIHKLGFDFFNLIKVSY